MQLHDYAALLRDGIPVRQSIGTAYNVLHAAIAELIAQKAGDPGSWEADHTTEFTQSGWRVQSGRDKRRGSYLDLTSVGRDPSIPRVLRALQAILGPGFQSELSKSDLALRIWLP